MTYNMHTMHSSSSMIHRTVVVFNRSFYSTNPLHSHTREVLRYTATGREDSASMSAENRHRHHSHSTTVVQSCCGRESQRSSKLVVLFDGA